MRHLTLQEMWVHYHPFKKHLIKNSLSLLLITLLTDESALIPWWHHQMETFSALPALCQGNPSVTGGFPSQRPAKRSFDVFFICASTNDWVNSGDAGDLRRHHAHYDATVMQGMIQRWPSSLTVIRLQWLNSNNFFVVIVKSQGSNNNLAGNSIYLTIVYSGKYSK